jgi:hypothetical protein
MELEKRDVDTCTEAARSLEYWNIGILVYGVITQKDKT